VDGYALPPARATLRQHALAIFFALVGGAFGILGAGFQELRAGGSILVFFAAAPVIEELLKPSGIYIVLWRWPLALANQLYTAILTAVSGISFGLIESLIYVTVYAPDHSREYFIYRFTVTIALHATASFIAGLGLNRGLFDWAEGRGRFSVRTRNLFIVAMVLHAAYNITAVVLELTGVLDFD
jgi:RsiW-degrading membrane proteinase PrsW (M82 family)